MFAGKTTALLQTCLRNEHKLLIVKPALDTRSPKNKIKNHNGIEFKCYDIEAPQNILKLITEDTNHVLIDETQFFPKSILKVVSELLNKKINVTLAGLLHDSNQCHFGSMPVLLAQANKKIELFAQCNYCNHPASLTVRKTQNSQTIQVGGKESYLASCITCRLKENV